jgi:eukaryotic-like serine/threonine-protein kinase
MSLQIGQQLGSYEVTSLIGKGGMGEVYRARDIKLKRDVAIKILPEEFSRDPDRVSRFQREAEVLASLNHPNIAVIYDVQEVQQTRFLVLELVDGETLAERIHRGRIPAEEALKIAHQIAEAVEGAHEKGVVHRDLKPANVKITPDGKIKVLDFGLSKALEASLTNSASNSPTILTAAATSAGVILGTASYMSPEQARGHTADQRSDIFSFGCVLFEMLTSQEVFTGETVADVIASVMAREPDWQAIPSDLHPEIKELIRRCLAKNRKDRWHAIADVRVELESIMADPRGIKLRAARGGAERPRWKRVIPIAITALLAAGAMGFLDRVMRSSVSPPVMRFSFTLPPDQHFTGIGRRLIGISPDAVNIIYVANDELYLRSLNDLQPRAIKTGERNISSPFFSPDGRSIAFFTTNLGENSLKRIPVTGGSAVTICNVPGVATSTWTTGNEIFIGGRTGILRVSANGGMPETVVKVQSNESAYGPQLLPGGEFLLFTIANPEINLLDRWDQAKIVVQSLKSGERKLVFEGGSDAQYVPTGHLIYAHASTLFAVPFDVKTLRTTDSPVPIIEGIRRAANTTGTVQFGFSNNGSIVYVPGTGPESPSWNVMLVDREGKKRSLDISQPGNYNHPRVSPDGKQLALQIEDTTGQNIWIYDLSGKASPRRLTFEGGTNTRPTWTRDGKRLVFTSSRGDKGNSIFWQQADGNEPGELLVQSERGATLQPESWLGQDAMTFSVDPGGGHSIISLLSLANKKISKLIEAAKGSVVNSNISPDGRWIAYWSNESGRGDIYVQPFPTNGTKYQISTSGNTHYPLWSHDGKQLFYSIDQPGGTGQMLSADIQTEPSFIVQKTTTLPIDGFVFTGPRGYDITPDDKYFVMMTPKTETESGSPAAEQINVTLNWFEDVKQRAGTN